MGFTAAERWRLQPEVHGNARTEQYLTRASKILTRPSDIRTVTMANGIASLNKPNVVGVE